MASPTRRARQPNANLDDAGEIALTDAIELLRKAAAPSSSSPTGRQPWPWPTNFILNDGRITHCGRASILQQLRLNAAPAQPTAPTQPAQSASTPLPTTADLMPKFATLQCGLHSPGPPPAPKARNIGVALILGF